MVNKKIRMILVLLTLNIFVAISCTSKENKIVSNGEPKKSTNLNSELDSNSEIEISSSMKSSNTLVSKSKEYLKKLNLSASPIDEIHIKEFPPVFQEFDVKNKDEIKKVVDFFISLHPMETVKKSEDYDGGSYTITFIFKNGLKREIFLVGNMFLKEQNAFTYEVPYKEISSFDTLVGNFLITNDKRDGYKFLKGKVISYPSQENQNTAPLIIKDDKGELYTINTEKSNVVDVTSKGSLILHDNDLVNISYKEKTESGHIVAKTIYIEKIVN